MKLRHNEYCPFPFTVVAVSLSRKPEEQSNSAYVASTTCIIRADIVSSVPTKKCVN